MFLGTALPHWFDVREGFNGDGHFRHIRSVVFAWKAVCLAPFYPFEYFRIRGPPHPNILNVVVVTHHNFFGAVFEVVAPRQGKTTLSYTRRASGECTSASTALVPLMGCFSKARSMSAGVNRFDPPATYDLKDKGT